MLFDLVNKRIIISIKMSSLKNKNVRAGIRLKKKIIKTSWIRENKDCAIDAEK